MKQEFLALEYASPHYDFKCTKELARRARVSGLAGSKFSDVGCPISFQVRCHKEFLPFIYPAFVFPVTARISGFNRLRGKVWGERWDLNPRPSVPQGRPLASACWCQTV